MKKNYNFCFKIIDSFEITHNSIPEDLFRRYIHNHKIEYVPENCINLDKSLKSRIYKDIFWDSLKLDNIPSGLDLYLFDCSVHSGQMLAVKWFQRSLRELNLYEGVIDGIIGDWTIYATLNCDNLKKLIRAIEKKRKRYLRGQKKYKIYKEYWNDRLVRVRQYVMFILENENENHQISAEIPETPYLETANSSIDDVIVEHKRSVGFIAGIGATLATVSQFYSEIQDLINKIDDTTLSYIINKYHTNPILILALLLILVSLYIWWRGKNDER